MAAITNAEKMRRYREKHPDKVAAAARRYYEKHRDRIRERQARYNEGSVEQRRAHQGLPKTRARNLWNLARKRAEQRGTPFSLTVEWIQEKIESGRCEATGLPFDLEAGRGRSPWAPSLDQVRLGDGYTPENTQVVVFAYNAAKGEWGTDAVLLLARAVVGRVSGWPA